MSNVATLNMIVTPEFEHFLKGAPFFLEIEMMQGFVEKMDDGRTKYSIIIEDPEKSDLVREFVLRLISNSHNSCKN